MSNGMKKAVWLAVLVVTIAAGVAQAGVEKEVANSGPQNWADLLKGRISFKEFLAKEKQRTPGPKCSEGYVWEIRGDEGYACWAKPGYGASVTCEVIGWNEEQDGEMGLIRRPILGKCTSSWGGEGGWAGKGPTDGHQAP